MTDAMQRAGIAAQPAFVAPPVVRAILSRLPCLPPTVASAWLLSAIAPRLIGYDALALLEGKSFRVAVRDLGVRAAFRIRHGAFVALADHRPADVTFTACAADFVALALRRADPDTLFFQRRLAVEGDTAAGLLLKNTLDALELPAWLAG